MAYICLYKARTVPILKEMGDATYQLKWVNSPGQEEDNSWQAFVFVPKDNGYIAKVQSKADKQIYNMIDFFPQSAKAIGINPMLMASSRKRCELMCKFLLERILQVCILLI